MMLAHLAAPGMIGVALLAIVGHEAAHGWMASRLGDHTARAAGRVSLRPWRHLGVVGGLVVPALAYASAGLAVGWCRDVPVSVRNLRRPRRDLFLIALAGPGANLLMAVGWGLAAWICAHPLGLRWLFAPPELLLHPALQVAWFGCGINLVIALANLVPLPPMDGGVLLPRPWARYWRRRRLASVALMLAVLGAALASGLPQILMQGLYRVLVR